MPVTATRRARWRTFRILLGLLLIVLGTAVTPTPVPVGLAAVTAGAGILIVESRVARRILFGLRRRHPRFSAWLRRAGAHLPAQMRRVLQRTDPQRDRPGR